MTEPPAIDLRAATMDDAELLLGWRNDPSTREVSFGRGVIALEDHLSWLREVLADPDRLIVVGSVRGVPVGVVRFDPEGGGAVISVTVAPGARGQGLGRLLIDGAAQWWFARGGGPVVARIKSQNETSKRAFAGAGFVQVAQVDDRIEMERRA